jgi:hypothetical protein
VNILYSCICGPGRLESWSPWIPGSRRSGTRTWNLELQKNAQSPAFLRGIVSITLLPPAGPKLVIVLAMMYLRQRSSGKATVQVILSSLCRPAPVAQLSCLCQLQNTNLVSRTAGVPHSRHHMRLAMSDLRPRDHADHPVQLLPSSLCRSAFMLAPIPKGELGVLVCCRAALSVSRRSVPYFAARVILRKRYHEVQAPPLLAAPSNMLRWLSLLSSMSSNARHVCCFHALGAETLKRVRASAETTCHLNLASRCCTVGQGDFLSWLSPGENRHSSGASEEAQPTTHQCPQQDISARLSGAGASCASMLKVVPAA